MAEGIEVRHSKKCGTRYGSGCNCTPTYQANAYDKRTGRLVRRTFPTKTAARRWRQEAIVALRQGNRAGLEPGRGPTVREALDALIAGMGDGTVLDRSGRRYRPGTIRSYRQAADRYLIPALGSHRVTDLARR